MRKTEKLQWIKTVSPTDLNEILLKFFAKVKTPSALTGIRAAIHRHLTCAPLSRNINILQDSESMSANKMFEAKSKLCYERKRCETKTQIIYSVRRQVGIEWILHGRVEHGWWLEKLVEFIWFSSCFHFAHHGRGGWWELTRQSFDFC